MRLGGTGGSGKVSPAKPGPGEGRGGNINIHNYAGAEVQARTLSNGDVEVIIRQAAEQGAALAERRIAGGISNGRSPVAGAISSRYEIQQKPRR